MANAGNPVKLTGFDTPISLMKLVLEKSGAGYLFQSGESEVLFSGNLPGGMQPMAAGHASDIDIFGSDQGARFQQARQAVLAEGRPASLEMELASPAGALTYRIEMERVHALDVDGILSVIIDVSETRHRERVLKTLLRELSHRSKNLLAIIQGIATQTARQALSLDFFLTAFRGRVQSLAYSQDLVTDSSWRGAYLFALVERQFSPYRSDPDKQIIVTGIDAHLSPNAALHIGLALHELIVNSASSGAIASGCNAIRISCLETLHEGRKAIEILWIEQLPETQFHQETGEHNFAQTVLQRVVPVAINGRADYVTTSEQIEYRLTVPAREFEILDRT